MNFPPFDTFPELFSERLLLRDLHAGDAAQLQPIFTYDGQPATNEQDVVKMLERIAGHYHAGEGINWGITDKKSGEILGTCGYYRGFPNGRGEIGFILQPAHYGKGYMSEAVAAVIAFGRNTLQLDSIIAVTKPSNDRAIRLLEKLGFTPTGPWEDGKGIYIGYQLPYTSNS